MSSHQLLRRYWESTRNGNLWFYMAMVIYPWNTEKVVEQQLGTVQRITDTRSPNFNKWVSHVSFEDNQLFAKKADAMAYVVTLVGLKQ